MEHFITILSLIVVSFFAALAVYYPDYDDTLLERFCLSGISIGALGVAYYVSHLATVPFPIMISSVCSAGYAIVAGRKIKKQKNISCTDFLIKH